jgi:hypothetical protein
LPDWSVWTRYDNAVLARGHQAHRLLALLEHVREGLVSDVLEAHDASVTRRRLDRFPGLIIKLDTFADHHPRRPSGFPSMSACRQGFTDCNGPPHSAQRSLAESAASVSPIEILGSQFMGRSRITRQRGQEHAMWV